MPVSPSAQRSQSGVTPIRHREPEGIFHRPSWDDVCRNEVPQNLYPFAPETRLDRKWNKVDESNRPRYKIILEEMDKGIGKIDQAAMGRLFELGHRRIVMLHEHVPPRAGRHLAC